MPVKGIPHIGSIAHSTVRYIDFINIYTGSCIRFFPWWYGTARYCAALSVLSIMRYDVWYYAHYFGAQALLTRKIQNTVVEKVSTRSPTKKAIRLFREPAPKT